MHEIIQSERVYEVVKRKADIGLVYGIGIYVIQWDWPMRSTDIGTMNNNASMRDMMMRDVKANRE